VSNDVRASVSGLIAVAAAYLLGFVVPGFRNVFALAALFLVAAAFGFYGWRRTIATIQARPGRAAAGLAVVIALAAVAVYVVIQPTYIGGGRGPR
jgi:hypothetical protein